jgi:hypothetical protein
VFVPFFPPEDPAVLRDPGQWQRFARLRDRVETDHDGLAQVRAVLAPVEDELWDAADAAFTAGTQAARTACTTEASARVTSGLTALGV